jgi:hypothetical protein
MGLLAKHNSHARVAKQNFSTLLRVISIEIHCGRLEIVSTYCPFTAAHIERGCQELWAKRMIVALSIQHVGVVAGAV